MRFNPRTSLTARLVLAFLGVSLLPIGILAYVSARESRDLRAGELHERAGEGAETLLGVPTATLELVVTAVSFALGLAIAVYIARSLLRPLICRP